MDRAILTRHRVRDGIQQLILSGKYRPGERLVQQDLAAQFGVAQSVVRESLLELQFCGLVQAVDHLGMLVGDVNGSSLLQAYEIREVLEGLAARLCCERANRVDVKELNDLAARARQSGKEGDIETMGSLDRQFHHRTVQASQNEILIRLTEAYRVLGMFVRASRDMGDVHREHNRLVAAIEANQPEVAETIARNHVRAARRSIQQQVAEGTFVLHPVEKPTDNRGPGLMPARRTSVKALGTKQQIKKKKKV